MEFYEINAILEKLHNRNRESWEQTRMVCYVIAQSNSTKEIKPTDIIKFSWDEDKPESGGAVIETKEIERLKEKAERYIKTKEDAYRFSNQAAITEQPV